MRIPKFRVRTMMIAILIGGALLGGPIEFARRWLSYKRILKFHGRREYEYIVLEQSRPLTDAEERKLRWSYDLSLKYLRLRSRPWLPAAPDPPEPQ